MIAVVAQATESQQTEQVITALILLLLLVAVLLALLTVWYWRHTSPRRVERRVGRSAPLPDAGGRGQYQQVAPAPGGQQGYRGGGFQDGPGYFDEHAPTSVQPRVVGHPGRR